MLYREKGIIPELQSRISKRRNLIADFEDSIAEHKAAGQFRVAYMARQCCNRLAQDQKLDKDLLQALCAARTFFSNTIELAVVVDGDND